MVMCGIAGAINFTISETLEHQKHRGNDNTGFLKLPEIELGHNRLAILDLTENGNQPLQNERYVLSYNGEWYDYRKFGQVGNDAHVLLQHLDANGIERGIQDVNGMFAFALYDKLLKKLHLLVDRMGQKPLYYYSEPGKFAFASSPAGLLHLKNKWKLNRKAVEKYFILGSTWGEKTLFEGINKLCGSYWLTYDLQSGEITKKRYWEPQFQDKTDGIEDLILDSINKVKVSDVPVFIFLSGGIDSTLVASQFKGEHAIHLESPEYSYAKQAADMFGVHLHEVKVKDANFNELIKDYVTKTGECSMAGHIPSLVSRETAKYCKVAVTANGADELFCGYDRHYWDDTKQMRHIFRPCYEAYLTELMTEMYPISGGISLKRWIELMTYVQFDLNKTLDFGSMCHTLEVRSPFLDHRLVEMALSIPEMAHFGKLGGKNILKTMLSKMGFDNRFLTRPKLGFSVHYQPGSFENDKKQAYKWCMDNNLFKFTELSGRDERYLESSALSFKIWFDTWKEKLDLN